MDVTQDLHSAWGGSGEPRPTTAKTESNACGPSLVTVSFNRELGCELLAFCERERAHSAARAAAQAEA